MPIARDVREIRLTRVSAHLVVECELSLIDTGFRGSMPRIVGAIEALGRSAGELRRVVCTHGHPDHAGSARDLALAGAAVLMHPADADGLRTTWRDAFHRPTRGRFFAAMTPLPPDVVPVHDGDVLPILGGLEVV